MMEIRGCCNNLVIVRKIYNIKRAFLLKNEQQPIRFVEFFQPTQLFSCYFGNKFKIKITLNLDVMDFNSTLIFLLF